MTGIVTIDFHVTCECSQECPYCWGPQRIDGVDTRTALRIIEKVRQFDIRRIVFTGGDPLQRADIGRLIRHARRLGLEVALSTSGDRLTAGFLRRYGREIDLISLPLDGSREDVNALTKQPGHFAAVMRALDALGRHPEIDVKLCTPVTRKNLEDIPRIARLIDRWARSVRNRVFYNVFQTFPRSMQAVAWEEWLVSDAEFAALRRRIRRDRPGIAVRFLTTRTLDRLYAMIFPEGSLVIPNGASYASYGRFLNIEDLDAVLAQSAFDAVGHRRHSRGWQKSASPLSRRRRRRTRPARRPAP